MDKTLCFIVRFHVEIQLRFSIANAVLVENGCLCMFLVRGGWNLVKMAR
jgi:hypothetical protein